MNVAADRLRHFLETAEQRIGAVLDPARRFAQADEHAVQEREALRIGVGNDALREFDERPRDGEGSRRLRQWRVGAEQVRGRVPYGPHHLVRRHAGQRQRPGRGAPAVKIVFLLKPDSPHRSSLADAGRLAPDTRRPGDPPLAR